MLGHGESYEANKAIGMPKGYFGKGKDSMAKTVADIMKLHEKAKEKFGSHLPYILYGHSMGSMVARYIYSTPEYAPVRWTATVENMIDDGAEIIDIGAESCSRIGIVPVVHDVCLRSGRRRRQDVKQHRFRKLLQEDPRRKDSVRLDMQRPQ